MNDSMPLLIAYILLEDLVVSAEGRWFFVAVALIMGSAVGSFLNVVAYRLPLGMSLNHPSSQCPKCHRPIRWRDNVPVFGWILLRGRCRDCRTEISYRYPLVELLVALSAALVTWSSFGPAVAFEPLTDVELTVGPWYSFDPLALGLQLVLVFTLWCAALIEFDGERVPWKLVLPMLALGLVLTTLWPTLRPAFDSTIVSQRTSWQGFLDNVRLLAAAILLAALAWPTWITRPSRSPQHVAAISAVLLATVSVCLGLSALVVIAVAAVAIYSFDASRRVGWGALLLTGTLLWITLGQQAVARWSALDGRSPWWLLTIGGGLVVSFVVASQGVRYLASKKTVA